VIEVNLEHEIVWQYGDPNDTIILNGAAFASRTGCTLGMWNALD
jgi:hypothetical protein